MTLFLLDADTAIYGIRRVRGVPEALVKYGSPSIAVSSLVYSQMLQGVVSAPDPVAEIQRIEIFVGGFQVKPYDRAAAACYGRIIGAVGFNRRNAFDRMIAAHAISLDATLVTNNVRDFSGIPDLSVTNWAEA